MSYLTRSRLFLLMLLLSGSLSPAQATPFPAPAWVSATIGLTMAQPLSPTTRHRPAAAALTDGIPALSDPLTANTAGSVHR